MNVKQKYLSVIKNAWSEKLSVCENNIPNELYLTLQPKHLGSLSEICEMLMRSFQARFVTIIPNDERNLNGLFSVYYVFSITRDDLFIIINVLVNPKQMEVPSISNKIEAANWFEREMKDWFGIIAFPNIDKIAAHPDWNEDVHPLLKDFDINTTLQRIKGNFDFKHVEGEGVFEIPVGPVHAGIIEPGHFRFSVAGEPIINLDIQLYYTHKATEKLAEQKHPNYGVYLAERISGDTSFAHAVAYCSCIERLANIELPKRAIVIRTILLELERLYNHIGDIGAMLLDVGYSVGASRAFYLKEKFLQLNELLTGSRLLHNVAKIGGVDKQIEDTIQKRQAIKSTLIEFKSSFNELIDWMLSTSSVVDRFETTGILNRKDALRIGAVGIAARASGIERDIRKDHPHLAYQFLKFTPIVNKNGDVLDRFNVRVEEINRSLELIEQLLGQHKGKAIISKWEHIPPLSCALGYVEGWRGEIIHWVMTDKDGNIFRWKITDPSQHNWQALTYAVKGNIVPDFPVINKSFNLSYSGNDR